MLMMKDRVFGAETTSMLWQSRPCRNRKFKKEVRVKGRIKVDQQEPEEPSLVKNKHMDQNCGQKKIVWWSKENEATKASLEQSERLPR